MKKILFVTTSSLDLENYTGDTIRAQNIIKYLEKDNKVDIVCLDEKKPYKKKINNSKIYFFKKNNLFLRLFYTLISLLRLKPLQIGFFYSKKIQEFLHNNHQNYDTIIFHLIRSAQYLPKKFKGKKILEMTDLMSNNYNQTKKNLSLFNFFYYLYFLESLLIKKYENLCCKIFDKIVIVSRRDLNNSNRKFNKKIIEITNGIKKEEKRFNFKKKNFKILFVGNINYLPNKYACYDFSKNILPKINLVYPEIQFHIVGKINFIDKIKLNFFKNVKVLGKINSLKKNIDFSICGVSNLQIATGVQNKIFTYMSYALPTIASSVSASGIKNLQNYKDFLVYQNNRMFINQIFQLKKNKTLAAKLSKNSYIKMKNFLWKKTLKEYYKII